MCDNSLMLDSVGGGVGFCCGGKGFCGVGLLGLLGFCLGCVGVRVLRVFACLFIRKYMCM